MTLPTFGMNTETEDLTELFMMIWVLGCIIWEHWLKFCLSGKRYTARPYDTTKRNG
jgi:hypothetical protein